MTYDENEAVKAIQELTATSGVEIPEERARQQWRGMSDWEKELVEHQHRRVRV